MYSTASNSALISVRMPQSFFLPTMISFGHLMRQSSPVKLRSALQTASPASGVTAPASAGAIFGRSSTENITFSSFLFCQVLPILPLPLTCSRAAATAPLLQPFAPRIFR